MSLKERYSDQDIIDKAFQAIASTRMSNRVADSVLLAQLEKWTKYPAHQVESAIKTYLQKDCAGGGKGEAYLLGIIRRNGDGRPKQKTTKRLIDQIEDFNGLD